MMTSLERARPADGDPRPDRRRPGGSAYVKYSHPASRYAVIGVAASITLAGRGWLSALTGQGKGDPTCGEAAVAIGGLVPAPTRCGAVEGALARQPLTPETFAAAADAVGGRSRRRPAGRRLRVGRVPQGGRPRLREARTRRGGRAGHGGAGGVNHPAIAREAVLRQDAGGVRGPPSGRSPQCTMPSTPASIDDLRQLLSEHLYIADDGLATAIYLALKLRRPLLLEGEAGVGKTEVAKVLAAALGARPDPPPMLRGAGRHARRLRVELRAATDRDPARGGIGCRGRGGAPRERWRRGARCRCCGRRGQ